MKSGICKKQAKTPKSGHGVEESQNLHSVGSFFTQKFELSLRVNNIIYNFARFKKTYIRT